MLMASDDFDPSFIIYIVIVVVIVVVRKISSWMSEKKEKEFAQRRQAYQEGRAEDHTPASDLESFLDSLSGDPDEQEERPLPPAQQVVSRVEASRARKKQRAQSPGTPSEPEPIVVDEPITIRSFIDSVIEAKPAQPAPPPPRPKARPAKPTQKAVRQVTRKPAAPPPSTVKAKKTSAYQATVAPPSIKLDLLRNPRSMRSAIVYMEVLGPPRSHRPFRRRM